MNTDTVRPPVRESEFLERCRYLTGVQVWPLETILSPSRWLTNFKRSERELAVNLLNGFVYLPAVMMVEMLKSAFQGLTNEVAGEVSSPIELSQVWQQFCQDLMIVRVTGETPNDSDSGYYFARLARQHLGIAQTQIYTHETALEKLQASPRPVVFVDDFVGSGRQFVETWRRYYVINKRLLSFEIVHRRVGFKAFYIPILCTEEGRRTIDAHCGEVTISPAHYLDERYSALHPESRIWPESLRTAGYEFVRESSDRAGIPKSRWRGFAELGLALAFEHSVPDATLPLFYWDQNGWNPLIRRT